MFSSRDRLPIFLWMVLSLAVFGPRLPAEETSPARQIFEDRIGVEIVNIDVAVSDRKGRPVEGLGPEDFELRIDGQEVPIANFYAMSAPRASRAKSGPGPTATPTAAPAGPNAAPAAAPLHLVVYFDNFYLTPQSRQSVLRDLPGFFERQIASGTRILLISRDPGARVITPFTTRLEELLPALEGLKGASASGLQQTTGRLSTLRSIQEIYRDCENSEILDPCTDCLDQMVEMARFYSLSRLSERRGAMAEVGGVVNALSVLDGRKALLYVSNGVERQTGIDLYSYIGEQLCPQSRQHLQQYFLHHDVKDLSELIAGANASRVTFYTLDAGGLRGFSSASVEHMGAFFVPSAGNDQLRFANLQSSLFYLAEETGGKAVLNTNLFATDLEKITDEIETFYSLGYQPRHSGRGRTHRVAVKIPKRNYEVRYRRSFLHKKPERWLADKALGAVLFEERENGLGVEVRPGSVATRVASDLNGVSGEDSEGLVVVPLEFLVPIEKLALIRQDGSRLGRLQVVLAAPAKSGRQTVIRKKEIPLDLPAESEASGEIYRFGVHVELPPGEHRLGVGVWDEVASTGSFLSVRVEAPDLSIDSAGRDETIPTDER